MKRILSVLRFLQIGNRQWYEYNQEEALAYVQSFNPPKDLWQRSYYQYKCHRHGAPKWKKPLLSFGSMVLFPFVLFYFRVCHITVKFIGKQDCVSECSDTIPMIPDSLREQYNFNFDAFFAGFSLSHKDVKYFFKHGSTYWKEPSFLFHALFKVAQYSNILHKYNPNVIVSENEFAFCSSLLTDYCRTNGTKHINMMHGERLLHIRNSFFEYDKCYVWHEHYKKLYTELRAEPSQFIVEIPPGLRIDVKEHFNPYFFADYKYYLGKNTKTEIQSIVNSLMPLKERGYSLKFRPHPIYTDMSILTSLLNTDEIEMPGEVNAIDSIASTNYVIGSFSTVLLQAYLCGKGVLMDDITFKERVEGYKSSRYILMNVEGPELLSKHIENNNN